VGQRRSAVQLRDDALAHSRRRWRPQLQVGERSLQVEAGAADHDRPAPVGQRGADLGVGQGGELSGGEGLRDRHEGEQPMLEPLALLHCGRTREDLQAAVHLKGVRRYSHRVLPTLAQAVGNLDCNGGLADPRRAEDRYQGLRVRHDR
jgi:hypothetical protein